MWWEYRLVHGKPCHSQSQGSIERANRDVEALLVCWQKENNSTKWSERLRFVWWQKNTKEQRHHSGIGTLQNFLWSKATTRCGCIQLPAEVQHQLVTEEQLEEAFGLAAAAASNL